MSLPATDVAPSLRARAATIDPLLGLEIGGYTVVEQIGKGGMSSVYRAELASIGAQVAIKVLAPRLAADPAFAKRFIAEARFANLVRHDGLVNVLGFGELPDGRPYQIMEYLVGEPLSAAIIRLGRIPLGTLCRLAAEACDALAAIHAQGLVHRDLKPSNLYVTASGRLKIIDFGIAKLTAWSGLTRTGQTLGTPEYMAPEQLEDGVVDGRTDLYALGVAMYEAATGRRPFDRRTLDGFEAWFFPVPSVREHAPELPAAVDGVVRKALQRDPDRRFADAGAMKAAIDALAATLAPTAFPAIARPVTAGPDALTAIGLDPRPGAADDGLAGAPTTEDDTATCRDPVAATREPETTAFGERLGRYQLCGALGSGGAGMVLLGLDPAVGRKVALKVLHDPVGDARDRLLAEARAMARVVHPNVVTLYELGDDAGRLFLAMELVEGTDLATWLAGAGTGRRPWRDVVDMFVAAGRGLAAAHAAGVIHRDFKPANVVVGTDGRARVTDFGVANDRGDGDGGGAGAGGTPGYMAPEQASTGGVADARTDQFAWCASLWEALHGQRPFAGDSPVSIARAARAGTIRPPVDRTIPPALTVALRRGLAPTCAARFPAMDALLAAITAATRRRPIGRTAPAIAGAAGVIAVALGVVAVRAGNRAAAARTPARMATLVDAQAAIEPGDRLRRLADLAPAERAGIDARWIATDAAAAGPLRTFDLGAPIVALGFSPAGTRVAFATADRITIHVVGAHDPTLAPLALGGAPAPAPAPVADRVVAVPASPIAVVPADDGTTVTVALADGVIEVAAATGRARDLVRCPGAIASPDLQAVACPGPDGSDVFAIRATADGRTIATAPGVFAFSADSQLALARNGGTVTAIDLATGRAVASIAAPTGSVIAAIRGWIAVATGDHLRVTTIASATTRDTALGLAPYRLDLTPAPSPLVIATSRDGSTTAFAVELGQIASTWNAGGIVTTAAAATGDQSVVVARAGGVELRRFRANRVVATPREATAVAIAADGTTVAFAAGSTASVWLVSLRPARAYPAPIVPTGRHRLAADGSALAYIATDDALVVRDLATGETHELGDTGAELIADGLDRHRVAYATGTGEIWTWDLAGAHQRRLGTVTGTIQDLWQIDGDRVFVQVANRVSVIARGREPIACGDRPAQVVAGATAVVADDRGALVCNADTGRMTTVPLGDPRAVAWWMLSVDGSRVAAALPDRVIVWRAADAVEDEMPGIAGARAVDLDRTGARALAITVDGLAVLDRGGTAAVALGRSAGAQLARLSADGRQVAAMIGNQITVWDVDRPDRPHVLGALTAPGPFALSLTDDASAVVVLGQGPSAGFDPTLALPWAATLVATVWPSQPAGPADLAAWLAAIE